MIDRESAWRDALSAHICRPACLCVAIAATMVSTTTAVHWRRRLATIDGDASASVPAATAAPCSCQQKTGAWTGMSRLLF